MPACTKPILRQCLCLIQPTYEGDPGSVVINGQVYFIQCLGTGSRDGYRLTNQDNGKVYDVDTSSGFPVCDCPDYTVRRGKAKGDYCKHGSALVELRRSNVI